MLTIRPGFEGALLQRARIKSKNADWRAAKQDYEAAGKAGGGEIAGLEEAEGAATLASDAEKAGDWEGCVSNAGIAIMVASTSLNLRQLRARCRFERGEVLEGVSDLAHVLQISPRSIDPHLQISSMLFYSVGDLEKGLAQIRKCLHSDPDSKSCGKLYKRQRQVDKTMKQIATLKEKRQFNSAVKLLVGVGEDVGLIQEVKEDVSAAKELGHIHKNSPNDFFNSLIELTCQLYTDVFLSKSPPSLKTWLTSLADEEQKESSPLLHRSPNPDPELATWPPLQSTAATRRVRVRSRDPNPQSSQRTPPVRR